MPHPSHHPDIIILIMCTKSANYAGSKYAILFSLITLPLCEIHQNVGDQASHTHKTTRKIIFLYILMLTFLDCRWEDKRS
jgi:hypothetical protein